MKRTQDSVARVEVISEAASDRRSYTDLLRVDAAD